MGEIYHSDTNSKPISKAAKLDQLKFELTNNKVCFYDNAEEIIELQN